MGSSWSTDASGRPHRRRRRKTPKKKRLQQPQRGRSRPMSRLSARLSGIIPGPKNRKLKMQALKLERCRSSLFFCSILPYYHFSETKIKKFCQKKKKKKKKKKK